MNALASTVAMLLYVGAAREDATPDQVAELRARVLPALEDGASDREVRRLVRDVMGRGWRPSPRWAEQVRSLA